MMHIITVYDSLNYGSYFQAHALQWYLQQYDKVDFVDIHHQSTFNQTMSYSAKKLLKGKLKDAALNFKKYLIFKDCKKTFPIVPMEQVKEDDICFFGSDEIWNISRKKMRKSKEFFGYRINSKNKIAMAPSVNNATYEEFKQYSYIQELLKDFTAISVRDGHSKQVIDAITNKDCTLVSDPTLLFPKEKYKEIQEENHFENYILLYTYGKMLNADVINEIKRFAKENNKKVISIGRWFDFCDECVAASPNEFLGFIDKADYVFTDTFHGVMFSMIYEKQFVVFPCNNTKVEEVLKIFSLTDRIKMVNETINDKTSKIIDYNNINKIKASKREATQNYIKNAIELSNNKSN